jgi:hypothetical protein
MFVKYIIYKSSYINLRLPQPFNQAQALSSPGINKTIEEFYGIRESLSAILAYQAFRTIWNNVALCFQTESGKFKAKWESNRSTASRVIMQAKLHYNPTNTTWNLHTSLNLYISLDLYTILFTLRNGAEDP